ncbi:MAG TPA: hypothetical protein VK324_10010 [Tepidisphaeraceae bacterium]|nr:hypothetical protein [Tepidisphaeraceae bacterium]
MAQGESLPRMRPGTGPINGERFNRQYVDPLDRLIRESQARRQDDETEPRRPSVTLPVKVMAEHATWGGVYKGRLFHANAQLPPDDETTLTENAIGTLEAGGTGTDQDCWVLNLGEVGETTHKLTDAGETPIQLGVLRGYHVDGLPIVILPKAGGEGDTPIGEFQHQVFQNVSQNQTGFDFVQAHALP